MVVQGWLAFGALETELLRFVGMSGGLPRSSYSAVARAGDNLQFTSHMCRPGEVFVSSNAPSLCEVGNNKHVETAG